MIMRSQRLVGVRIAAHQVLDADFISAAESMAIGFAVVMRNRRMTEFVTVLNVGRTMVLVILARALDAVVETLRFYSLNLSRRVGPYFMTIIWRRWRWTLLCLYYRNA